MKMTSALILTAVLISTGAVSILAGWETTGKSGCAAATDRPASPHPSGPKWISAYYVGYQRHLYPPDKIDFSSITHLVVGRVTPKPDGSLYTTFDIDLVSGPEMAHDLVERTHAAGKKAILMVGGAGEYGWSSAASDAVRPVFVSTLITYLKEFQFDGLDLDWEPISEDDQPKLKALAQDLRFKVPGIILTLPVGWVGSNNSEVDNFYREIDPLFDQINIMTYSMADDWPGWRSWHMSALRGESSTTPSSVESSVNAYIEGGVPAHKLGIGLPFYGSCWQGVNGPLQFGGRVVASDNEISFTNIMKDYFNKEKRRWDDTALTPYLHFDKPVGPSKCTFISYEDAESIRLKGKFIHERGLGGTIIWTINQGYIETNPENDNPLLRAAAESILKGR